MTKIVELENTDTSNWPPEYVKLFLTNFLAGGENEEALARLDNQTHIIQAEDSGKDLETGEVKRPFYVKALLNQYVTDLYIKE